MLFLQKSISEEKKKYKFCSNRSNLNGLRKIKLPNKSIALAELIGICLGDGYISKYQVAITLNAVADNDYIPYVAALINTLFPEVTISYVIRKNDNAIDVRINSKIVADFLYNMGIIPNAKSIPPWILNNFAYSKACIRGLFDTEGSISFKKYLSKDGVHIYKQLNFRNIDVQLMLFVRNNLIRLGLKPTMTFKKSLYLSNNTSIALFRKQIGFSNPKLLERSLIYDENEYKKLQT